MWPKTHTSTSHSLRAQLTLSVREPAGERQAFLKFDVSTLPSDVDNVAIGNAAMLNNSTGSRNTALGFNAGFFLTTGNDNVAIAHPGVAGDSGTIRIGTSQSATHLAGVRNATAVSGAVVVVDANGRLGVGSISEVLRLAPRSAARACTSADLGALYVDGDSSELCMCDGSGWTGLRAGGQCQ